MTEAPAIARLADVLPVIELSENGNFLERYHLQSGNAYFL